MNETIFTQKELRKHVRMLQRYLQLIDIMNGEYQPIIVDGYFGTQTAQAVERLQQQNGLEVNGEVDQTTFEAIYQAYLDAKREYGMPESPYIFPLDPNFLVTLSDSSPCVLTVQSMLSNISQTSKSISLCETTGVYDAQTASSIMQLQEITQLPPTGDINRATWNALVNLHNSVMFHHRRHE